MNIKKWLNLEFYISELDQFLKAFDRKHTKLSASQRKEIAKYKRIHEMRDMPVAQLNNQDVVKILE